MIVVAIDPGLTGAIAWHKPSYGLICQPMPVTKEGINIPALALLCSDLSQAKEPVHVFIEKAQAMPKQGVTSMFSYGTGYGILQGVVGAFGFPFTLVPPRVWTKVMHAGVSTDISAKEKSLVAALRLFPDQNFLATPRSTKPHQGLIDACLINEYGRRVLGANQETLRALVSTSA